MADQNNVKVIEKNAGPKIAYEQTGTCLIFGDYELMINAAKYQKDWDVTVDICKDKGRKPYDRHRVRAALCGAGNDPGGHLHRDTDPDGRKGPSLWQKERRRRHEPRQYPERAEPARHGRRYARTLEH